MATRPLPGPMPDTATTTDSSRPTDRGFALYMALALPLCWSPTTLVPGFDMLLAPLFYLIAGQHWGFRRGLIATVILMAPTLFWWGQSFRIFIAIGHYVFVQHSRRRGLLYAESTAIYNLVLGPVLAALIVVFWYDAPSPISLLVFLKTTIGEVLLAATCDVLIQNFRSQRTYPFIIPRTRRSLDKILRTMINFVIVLLFSVTMANEVQSLNRLEEGYRAQVRGAAEDATASYAGRDIVGKVERLPQINGASIAIFLSTDGHGFTERARARLGPACRHFVNVDLAVKPHASDFDYWVSVCEIDHVRRDGQDLYIASSFREVTIQHYLRISLRMFGLLAVSIFALLYRVSLTRSLRETLDACTQIVSRFGTPNLSHPPLPPFDEVDLPIRQFVARNNSYVAAKEERDRLLDVAVDLKRSIDLRLMSDIGFEAETGKLSFTEIRFSYGPLTHELQVHTTDCPLFVAATGSDEAIIEFRTAQGEEFESLILTLRNSTGPYRWASGMIVKLWQPRRLREIMTRQARLVDLGGMASAISHEIKQPLFTISIAAESIRLLLTKPDSEGRSEQLANRTVRISEQVERAREIIDRISQYGRLESLETSETDVAAAVHAARSFLAALLHDRAIKVSVSIGPGSHIVAMPRIALEQVIVNAIQNAVDAIEIRREAGPCDAGNLTLCVENIDGQLCCTVADDGIGLKSGLAETAFEAFFTTKADRQGTGLGLFISRQIVMEAGGDIRLSANEPHGARLEILFPNRGG